MRGLECGGSCASGIPPTTSKQDLNSPMFLLHSTWSVYILASCDVRCVLHTWGWMAYPWVCVLC